MQNGACPSVGPQIPKPCLKSKTAGGKLPKICENKNREIRKHLSTKLRGSVADGPFLISFFDGLPFVVGFFTARQRNF